MSIWPFVSVARLAKYIYPILKILNRREINIIGLIHTLNINTDTWNIYI